MTNDSDRALPTAPSALQRWFPFGAWIGRYDWRHALGPDLIAAVGVAALLIPESMGDASVAGATRPTWRWCGPSILSGGDAASGVDLAGDLDASHRPPTSASTVAPVGR